MSDHASCPSCRARITPECTFCPACGTSLAGFQSTNGAGARIPAWKRVEMEKAAQEEAQSQGSDQPVSVSAQPMYQQPQHQPQYPTYSPVRPLDPDMPMKWYKFVIYFQLFAGAILNGLFAVTLLTGTSMQLDSYTPNKNFYPYFDGLQAVDMLYGLAIIAVAILGLVARSALKNFKASGPKLYYATLICNTICPIAYALLVCTVVPALELDMAAIIAQLIPQAILLTLNIVYFKKRDHLFCN